MKTGGGKKTTRRTDRRLFCTADGASPAKARRFLPVRPAPAWSAVCFSDVGPAAVRRTAGQRTQVLSGLSIEVR